MTSPLRKQRGDQGMRLGNPSVTLSTCDPKQQPAYLQPKGDGLGWESTMFHRQNLSDELLPRMTGGSPATDPRMAHLGVGHINTSSKSMDGLNSNAGALSAEHPAFARTRQYRSMSNDDMKTEMLPQKRLPGEPTNYMEAAAAALQTGKGSSIIDNLMKEYRSGNLYARQPADLLLPSAKEDPTQMPTQMKTDLALHRENSAPQLSASRERQMKSPPEYPGHSRFAQNFDLTPSSTPRASSPQSVMSDMDFPTSRSNRSVFGSRDTSSVFGDFDTSLSSRSRGRVHSPFSTMHMSDFDQGAPPPEYPGFKRTPWQSHSGREFRSRKESATVDHSRASSFGSYQHSLNMKRLSSETSYDSSRASSTSSTSPLSTDAPAPHPSPASQASQANFELDHEAIASRATHMVEILSDENSVLRQELETNYQKVAKLLKFEQEIHKVQTEHEKLIESTHKREHLEKLVRAKLEVEVKKLQERNRDLTESRAKSSRTANHGESIEADLQEELTRKENALFQTQMTCKDLDETNMQLMNELTEQRLHVDMLDAALSKAQADVNKLHEECAQRQVYVDKVRSLQQLVTSLQAARQKREKLENKLRHKMEKEIEKLRGRQSVANQDEGVSEPEDVTSESLAEKESTILKLEAEVSKWEHKYLEECAIRQCHVEAPPNSRLSGVHDMDGGKERDEEGSSRHKARIYDLEKRVSALTTEVQKREIIIQALQNQIFATMSSTSLSSYPENIRPPSPQQQSYRRGSVDSTPYQSNLSGSPAVSSSSLQNLGSRSPASSVQNLQQQQQQSPASSTHSLQHYLTKSPATSTQNLHMSPASSNQNLVSKSPASSLQNLPHVVSLGGRSPAGSQQSLGALARPPSHTGSAGSGLGSQERLMGFSDSYTSLSTSGLSMTGTDGGSEADLARERSFLDEKLKQLDLEIAQQDKILGSIWKT